jgi:hypothetical protein
MGADAREAGIGVANRGGAGGGAAARATRGIARPAAARGVDGAAALSGARGGACGGATRTVGMGVGAPLGYGSERARGIAIIGVVGLRGIVGSFPYPEG